MSSLVDNLLEGFHCDQCIDCKYWLYIIIRDDQLILRCFECKKNYQKEFSKYLINKFPNTYEFCKKDINKFILLLRKGICSYEYIFDDTSLPDKEAFHNSLNIEGITSVDYRHAKRYIKNLKYIIWVIIMISMFKVIHSCLQVYLKILEMY